MAVREGLPFTKNSPYPIHLSKISEQFNPAQFKFRKIISELNSEFKKIGKACTETCLNISIAHTKGKSYSLLRTKNVTRMLAKLLVTSDII